MIYAHMEFPWWVGIFLTPVYAYEWAKDKLKPSKRLCPRCEHPEHKSGVCDCGCRPEDE